jgi:16S rRNA (cytosine967-C5)-methyltransferase
VALLHAVLVLGRPLDGQLDRHLAGLAPRDRGLARALASAVLRHQPGLDRLIDQACAKRLPDDARARQALRVALAGKLILDLPAHAVIATALPLVEGGPRRLVHGVLGTLLRGQAELPPPRLPGGWEERWEAAWGRPQVDAAVRLFAGVPPIDLGLHDPGETQHWVDVLGGRSLFPGHVRLDGSHDVAALPGFAEGAWWVQDAAASLPARLLGDVEGRRVLDLCAAPGGKTMQLAALGADVTALDASAERMVRLKDNLARTRLAARTVVADVLAWEPEAPFDAVLIDAPCSATGTFRRHPDVLHLRDGDGLKPMTAIQRRLLERAGRWLKPGGRLVYAVCSLEREEGEAIVAAALPGLEPEDVARNELPAGVTPTGSTVRTLPSVWGDDGGGDGFFIARWRRVN